MHSVFVFIKPLDVLSWYMKRHFSQLSTCIPYFLWKEIYGNQLAMVNIILHKTYSRNSWLMATSFYRKLNIPLSIMGRNQGGQLTDFDCVCSFSFPDANKWRNKQHSLSFLLLFLYHSYQMKRDLSVNSLSKTRWKHGKETFLNEKNINLLTISDKKK